jgi:hypothetical protein
MQKALPLSQGKRNGPIKVQADLYQVDEKRWGTATGRNLEPCIRPTLTI